MMIIAKAIRLVNTFSYLTANSLSYNFGNMKRETFAARLLKAMSEAGHSQASLGEAVGMSQPSVWKLTSGKTKNTRKLYEISKVLGVNPDWLSEGNPPMRLDGQMPEEKVVHSDIYRVDVLDVQASAGPGTMLTADFIETIRAIEYTPEKGRALFGSLPQSQVKVITVRGDSMEGTIDPGDEIFVNVGVRDFDGDGIYVFVFGNTLHVKRLQMHKDRMLVLSDNDRYKEWYIEEEDHDRFHVMAKVLIKQTIAYKRFG